MYKFVVIFFLTFCVLNSKDSIESKYTTWTSALSMQGEPRHKNAKYLPYANPQAKKGGSFKAMAIGGFDSLDLFVLKGNKADSLNLIYDTLMSQSLDEPYAIYPLIADKLSIASDYSGVRFHINPRARFADGSPIKASDVKFSFDMLIEKGDPTQARYYADVAESKVINDSIIEFRFKNTQNKELPFILTQLNIVPRDFYFNEKGENDYGAKPLRIPLGSGPYRISNYKINSQITYERNTDYWARDLMVNRGVYNFDKIIIEYYKDENVALQGFLSGEYDFRFEPSAKAWANSYKGSALSAGRFKMLEFPHGLPAGMQGFYLNTRNKFLADIALREAINQAFDFEWSNKYLFFSQYKRTKSYYENSIYASSGKISENEIKILKELGILEELDNKNSKTDSIESNSRSEKSQKSIGIQNLDSKDSQMKVNTQSVVGGFGGLQGGIRGSDFAIQATLVPPCERIEREDSMYPNNSIESKSVKMSEAKLKNVDNKKDSKKKIESKNIESITCTDSINSQNLGFNIDSIKTQNLTINKNFINEIDPRVLKEIYTPPQTNPPHSKRENLKYAMKLLKYKGFYIKNNQLYNSQNEPISFSILLNSPLFERIVLPFKKNLAILGIPLQIILVDSTQYENRVKNFDFDIIVGVVPQSLFPGNEQDFFFSSHSRTMSGSRNFSGVNLKSIDLLIDRLNKTQDLPTRVAILRAMDRILLWQFYVVPHFYSPNFRIAVKSDVKIPRDSKGELLYPPYSSPFSAFYFWWRE